MDTGKAGKVAALALSIVVVGMSFWSGDWRQVGIYAGCPLAGRLLYPFFHVSLLHAVLNAWCLLQVAFIYGITPWRLLAAYATAATVPVGMVGLEVPTVGLSGVVFFLLGSLSFTVCRRWYWQGWMLSYICIGFLLPAINALLHLYCYAVGIAAALLVKPINIKRP